MDRGREGERDVTVSRKGTGERLGQGEEGEGERLGEGSEGRESGEWRERDGEGERREGRVE